MTSQVATGFVRLNGQFFNEERLQINKHKLSQTEQVSYPTVHKYIFRDENGDEYDVRKFSGDVLYAILTRGMGYSLEQIRELKFGDVFEIVEERVQ